MMLFIAEIVKYVHSRVECYTPPPHTHTHTHTHTQSSPSFVPALSPWVAISFHYYRLIMYYRKKIGRITSAHVEKQLPLLCLPPWWRAQHRLDQQRPGLPRTWTRM